MKIYVKAASKAAINRSLAAGEPVVGYNHSMFGGGGWYSIAELQDNDVVAIWDKTTADGSPIAKSWGSYDKTKNRLK